MNREFEFTGLWREPTGEINLTGTLKFTPNQGGRLTLVGTFKNITVGDFNVNGDKTDFNDFSRQIKNNPEFEDKKFIKILHGLTIEGKRITLYNCLESDCTFSLFNGNPVWKTVFWVQTVVIGDLYTKELDQINIKSVTIEQSFIGKWMNSFIIGRCPDFGKGELYLGTSFKEQRYCINNDLEIVNTTIAKINESSISGNINNISIERKSFFNIAFSDPRTWKEYYEIVIMLRNLFFLLTHQSISILSITFTSFDSFMRHKGNLIYPEMEVHFAFAVSQDFSSKLQNDFLIKYHEILNFDQIIKEWFSNYNELKPIYELLFNSMANKNMYLYHSFLSMIQALESLHRIKFPDNKSIPEDQFTDLKNKINGLELTEDQMHLITSKLDYANELNLRKRLNHILSTELNEMKLFKSKKSINNFVSKVVNTRNYLTHYDKSLKSKTASEPTLREITDKLQLIIYFWLLTLLGFNQQFLKKIFERHWKYNKLW